jgi:hypothetical protein
MAGLVDGTARLILRGQNPEAAARDSMIRPVWTNSATMKLAVEAAGKNGTRVRDA